MIANFMEVIHKNNVVFYTCGYSIGMYTKQEIKDLIKQGVLYESDYKGIVGEDYVADSAQPQTTTQN